MSNLCYLRDLPDSVKEKRKKYDNQALRRMISAESHELDDKLKENGYEPEFLRKEFYSLYGYYKQNPFIPEKVFYDVVPDRSGYKKIKNNLENLLLGHFEETIPIGYLVDYELIFWPFDPEWDVAHIGKRTMTVIFLWLKDEKLKYIKATVKFTLTEDIDNGGEELEFNEINFEEMNAREAFDSIPGIGNCIHDHGWRNLAKSLID